MTRLGADLLPGCGDSVCRTGHLLQEPETLQTFVTKLREHLDAVRRVRDLRVELHAVELQSGLMERTGGVRAGVRRRKRLEAVRAVEVVQSGHP